MRRFVFLLLFLVTLSAPSLATAVALGGLDDTAGAAGIKNSGPRDLYSLTGNTIGSIVSLVGVLFFCLMLYAGFLWTTASGDEKKVEKAKAILVAAIIGLLIVASAYVITMFAGNTLKGTTTL